MNANELRIGNWVRTGILYLRVESIHEKGINIYSETDYSSCIIEADARYDSINPIPLTPDILEKCGFDIDLNNFNWNAFKEFENNGLSHYVTLRFNEKRGWFFNHAASPVKHVHQLQNLYFVLTGEELEINL